MEDEIEALGGDLPIRREVAVFIALAPGYAEAKLCYRRARRWQRPRAPHTAALAADGELVEILVPCLKSGDLDMHGVAEFGMGCRRALLHDLAHTLVSSHRPVDLHRFARHATTRLERSWRELCPDHEAVRRRVTRCDAEREGIGCEDGARPDAAPEEATRRREQRGGTKTTQERAAIHGAEGIDVEASRESITHDSTPFQTLQIDLLCHKHYPWRPH